MDIGTGIAVGLGSGSTILGIVAIIFRLFPKKSNPGNPGNSLVDKRFDAMNKKIGEMRKEETCDEIVKRIEGIFGTLKEIVDTGFKNMNKQFDEIRKGLK